jgi:hypothetical protein
MPASTAQPDSEVASTAMPATHTAETQTIASAALMDRRISEEYARWLKGTVSECTHEPLRCAQAHRQLFGRSATIVVGREGVSFGENHMLFIVGVIVLVAAVVIPRMRVPGGENATHLGWMSERWLAEHRASHSE